MSLQKIIDDLDECIDDIDDIDYEASVSICPTREELVGMINNTRYISDKLDNIMCALIEFKRELKEVINDLCGED